MARHNATYIGGTTNNRRKPKEPTCDESYTASTGLSIDPGLGFRVPSPLPTVKEVRIGGVCVD